MISEPVYLDDPFEPGKRDLEGEIDESADTARRYLADDEARRRITETARTFVTEELTPKRSFADLLELAAWRVPGPDVEPSQRR